MPCPDHNYYPYARSPQLLPQRACPPAWYNQATFLVTRPSLSLRLSSSRSAPSPKMLTTAVKQANRHVARRDSKRLRFGHEVGTISLEGTPIDEKADAISVEYIECRSAPATPAGRQPGSMHDDFLPQGINSTKMEKDEQWFVGAVDQGTTSSRFLIFNAKGEPVANHQIEFDNLYPQSG